MLLDIEVCLPVRSEIEKPGNLFHGKIFQSSGKASGLAFGALNTSQPGVGRCLTGSLASIEFWKEQDALESLAGDLRDATKAETRSKPWHISTGGQRGTHLGGVEVFNLEVKLN
jgi:hypothetical protein